MVPNDNVGFLLQRVAFLLQRHNDQVLQEQLGIGFSQFKILLILQWKPDVRQRYIAESLGQTEASISRQIKLMKNKGLITSKVNPKSKREHLTTLTKKGNLIIDKATEILNRYHGSMFAGLGAKRESQLIEALNVMHGYVDRD